jgi:hypothetical protein
LRPGAVFILEFANKHNLKAILRYLLRRQSWNPFTHDPVEFAELNYDFHPAAVRAWLRAVDFSIERQLTVSHFRLGALKRLVPLKLLVWMDAQAQWTGSLWQLTPSVFVKSYALNDTPVAKPGTFFRCPVCQQSLPELENDHLDCPDCSTRWMNRDGIYDFKEPMQ